MEAAQYICNISNHMDTHIPVSTWPHMSTDLIASTGFHNSPLLHFLKGFVRCFFFFLNKN